MYSARLFVPKTLNMNNDTHSQSYGIYMTKDTQDMRDTVGEGRKNS